MPLDPKISVLMSVFNAEPYVREAIESILNQTYTNLELLVADDGSSDRTRQIVDSFNNEKRIKIFHNEDNLGKVATINRLFEQSSGEYVTVHDGDDVSKENRFEVQLSQFEKDPDLVMCGTWFNYVNLKGEVLSECRSIGTYDTILKEIRNGSVFHGPTTLIKKKYLEQLGVFFRPYFETYHEDADLNYRLCELGPCYNVPANVYDYRVVPGSLSKTFSPRKLVLYKLVHHFAEQRASEGKDDLQTGNIANADAFVDDLLTEYRENPSKFYHEAASRLMQFGLTKDATKQAYQAIKVEPLKLANYRLLQYCIRKSIGL